MNYSQRLKDPRWFEFRESFKASRYDRETGQECDECGADTCGRQLHVHHRLYIPGREPWEYEFGEMRLVCADCHNQIHETESLARAFIISLEANECYEMDDLLRALVRARRDGMFKIAAIQAAHVAEDVCENKDRLPVVFGFREVIAEALEIIRKREGK